MKAEIIEFYPIVKRKDAGQPLGHLSIYLIEEDLDINGVVIRGTKDNHKIQLPVAWSQRHDTGERVRYPLIRFCCDDSNIQLIKQIRAQATPFLKRWFEKHPEAKPIARLAEYCD